MSEHFLSPQNFLRKSKTYALVGASSTWQDHAYHLFLELEKQGYKITPVSTTDTNICGVPAYPSFLSFPPVDGVIFATKDEEIALKFLREMRDTDLNTAWFENMPDMTTSEMKNFAQLHFIETVQDHILLDMLQKGEIAE